MFRFLHGPRILYVQLAVLWFCFSVFSTLSVSMVMPFVNLLFNEDFYSRFTLPTMDKRVWLLILCGMTWLMFFLKNVFYVLAQNRSSRLQTHITLHLRKDISEKLFYQPYSFFSTNRAFPSFLLAQIPGQWAEARIALVNGLFKNIPLIIFYTLALLVLNWKLTLLSLFIIPIVSWVQNLSGHKTTDYLKHFQNRTAEFLDRVENLFRRIKLIKIEFAEQFERDRLYKQDHLLQNARHDKNRILTRTLAFNEVFGVTMGVVMLGFAGWMAIEGEFLSGPGGFVLYIAAIFSLLDPLKGMGQARIQLREIQSLEKMSKELAVLSPHGNTSKPTFDREIQISDVALVFGNQSVFNRASFSVSRGEKIALIGTSGVGKSSMLDMLCGLVPPTDGHILIDQIPVEKIDPKDRAKLFGIFSQDPILFKGALRDNILYNRKCPDDLILQAITRAQMMDWYSVLQTGLDTLIHPEALSGGEKQRLALARLMIQNPEIILLDEATSAMDLELETKIYEMIFEEFAGKTMIVVSHRPAILKFVDRVMEIKDGAIGEISISQSGL